MRGRPIVVPLYDDERGRNPVLLRRAGVRPRAEATGDRGLGPMLAAHPELVVEVDVAGTNPDVDTPADLARRDRGVVGRARPANREQVERLREIPDGADFYAPVQSLFRADPTRTDDPILDALLDLVRPGEVWLDVGAGAGRFALPIARALDPSGGSVVALDRVGFDARRPARDRRGLRDRERPHGRGALAARRMRGAVRRLEADVALIAHVGYDIEAIGPFLDALEAAAGRLCVAVLMERVPASAADPFWPPVHGETRVPLPALPDLLELLEARGRRPSVTRLAIEPRRFESRDALESFIRRQMWIDPAGRKEKKFQAALDALVVNEGDGWTIEGRGPSDVGVVTWTPGAQPD